MASGALGRTGRTTLIEALRVMPFDRSLRRQMILGLAALLIAPRAVLAAAAPGESAPRLDRAASQALRMWIRRIVQSQLEHGPTPRWTHRDCAGLVRFAVAEALRPHDEAWRRSMGLAGVPLPPEPALAADVRDSLRHKWRRADGTQGAYVGALELVQENTRLVSRDAVQALPADLLFFDQGDEQHLMIALGRTIAYHTGRVTPGDNGLRAVELRNLLAWKDTRWHPDRHNPNFAGIYRFSFLSDA